MEFGNIFVVVLLVYIENVPVFLHPYQKQYLKADRVSWPYNYPYPIPTDSQQQPKQFHVSLFLWFIFIYLVVLGIIRKNSREEAKNSLPLKLIGFVEKKEKEKIPF